MAARGDGAQRSTSQIGDGIADAVTTGVDAPSYRRHVPLRVLERDRARGTDAGGLARLVVSCGAAEAAAAGRAREAGRERWTEGCRTERMAGSRPRTVRQPAYEGRVRVMARR